MKFSENLTPTGHIQGKNNWGKWQIAYLISFCKWTTEKENEEIDKKQYLLTATNDRKLERDMITHVLRRRDICGKKMKKKINLTRNWPVNFVSFVTVNRLAITAPSPGYEIVPTVKWKEPCQITVTVITTQVCLKDHISSAKIG